MQMTAFLFPGQGSQFAGMGKSLADVYPEARAVFDEADRALGFSISKLCFEGPDEELKLTENTQPALVTVSVAAYRVLQKAGIKPDFVAGHSLGEYSALVAAGCLQFADAVRLVRKRGQFMQKAVPQGVGAMAAILRLPQGKLDAILTQAAKNNEVVAAANFNSPDQVVVAGHKAAVERAAEAAKAAGAKRAVMLPVSAPFHCPLMKPAQEKMKTEFEAVEFSDLEIPLVNNWQAREIRTGTEAREGLIAQIPSPVLWTQTVKYLASRGVGMCVEVGPGSVLTGLLRAIEPALQGSRFGESQDMEKMNVAAV